MSKRRRKARQWRSRGRKLAEAYEARQEELRELVRHAEQVKALADDVQITAGFMGAATKAELDRL